MVQKVEMCPKSRSDVGKLCGSVIRVIIVSDDVLDWKTQEALRATLHCRSYLVLEISGFS